MCHCFLTSNTLPAIRVELMDSLGTQSYCFHNAPRSQSGTTSAWLWDKPFIQFIIIFFINSSSLYWYCSLQYKFHTVGMYHNKFSLGLKKKVQGQKLQEQQLIVIAYLKVNGTRLSAMNKRHKKLCLLHDWQCISPWIKSISNWLNITIHVSASQLFGHYDVVSNRLWCHQQNELQASDTWGQCVKIVTFIVIYGFIM